MLYFIYIWHARSHVHVYITIYIRSKCRFVSSKLVFSLYVYNFTQTYVELYLSFWKFSKAWLSTLNCHIGMSSATYAKYRAGKYFSWCHMILQVYSFKINEWYPYQIYFTLNAWLWETYEDISINIISEIRCVIYQIDCLGENFK